MPDQEVAPQPPDPLPPLEISADTLVLARATVFAGFAEAWPSEADKDLVARAIAVTEALRFQPTPEVPPRPPSP